MEAYFVINNELFNIFNRLVKFLHLISLAIVVLPYMNKNYCRSCLAITIKEAWQELSYVCLGSTLVVPLMTVRCAEKEAGLLVYGARLQLQQATSKNMYKDYNYMFLQQTPAVTNSWSCRWISHHINRMYCRRLQAKADMYGDPCMARAGFDVNSGVLRKDRVSTHLWRPKEGCKYFFPRVDHYIYILWSKFAKHVLTLYIYCLRRRTFSEKLLTPRINLYYLCTTARP